MNNTSKKVLATFLIVIVACVIVTLVFPHLKKENDNNQISEQTEAITEVTTEKVTEVFTEAITEVVTETFDLTTEIATEEETYVGVDNMIEENNDDATPNETNNVANDENNSSQDTPAEQDEIIVGDEFHITLEEGQAVGGF